MGCGASKAPPLDDGPLGASPSRAGRPAGGSGAWPRGDGERGAPAAVAHPLHALPRPASSASMRRANSARSIGTIGTLFLDCESEARSEEGGGEWLDAAAIAAAAPAVADLLRRYQQGEVLLCKAVGEALELVRSGCLTIDELEALLSEADAANSGGGTGAAHSAALTAATAAQAAASAAGHAAAPAGPAAADAAAAHHPAAASGLPAAAAAVGHRAAVEHLPVLAESGSGEAGSDGCACIGPPGRSDSPLKEQQPPPHAAAAAAGGGRPQHGGGGRRWAPHAGDTLFPGAGCKPLAPDTLGLHGAHLFSGAHLAAHTRVAAELLHELEASKAWPQVAFGALKLWHRHDKAAGLQQFRVECVIEEAVLNMMTICREVDLAPSWNPAISVMKTMLEASLSEVLIYLGLWLPWPFSEPEILMRALGLNLLDTEGAMLMSLQDLGDDIPPGAQMDAQSHERTRYHIQTGAIRLTPLPPDPVSGHPRLNATVIASLDAKRVPINDTIISFLLKVFAPVVYRSVTQTCRRLFHATSVAESPLLQRQAGRPWLYVPQAAAIDASLAAGGIAPQRPVLEGLRGVQLSPAAAAALAPR